MNHRVLERTLRPVVFRRACLFERRFILLIDGLSLRGPPGRRLFEIQDYGLVVLLRIHNLPPLLIRPQIR